MARTLFYRTKILIYIIISFSKTSLSSLKKFHPKFKIPLDFSLPQKSSIRYFIKFYHTRIFKYIALFSQIDIFLWKSRSTKHTWEKSDAKTL